MTPMTQTQITAPMIDQLIGRISSQVALLERAISRDVQSGMITLETTNNMQNYFIQKVAIVVLNGYKSGMTYDANQIMNTILGMNMVFAPVLTWVNNQGLTGTLISQGMNFANSQVATLQNMNTGYNTNMGTIQMNNMPNTMLVGTQPQQNLTANGYSGSNRFGSVNKPIEQPIATGSNNSSNRFNTQPLPGHTVPNAPVTEPAPINTPKVVPIADTLPRWLCAFGVSMDYSKNEAIGKDEEMLEFTYHPFQQPEETKGSKDLSSVLRDVVLFHPEDTYVSSFITKTSSRLFKNSVNNDLFLSKFTSRVNTLLSNVCGIRVDHVHSEYEDLLEAIESSVKVIRHREHLNKELMELRTILDNEIANIEQIRATNGTTNVYAKHTQTEEVVIVHSSRLLRDIVRANEGKDVVKIVSEFSHKGFFDLLFNLYNESKFKYLTMYVVSIEGVLELQIHSGNSADGYTTPPKTFKFTISGNVKV